ncbi:RNA polymerase sigma factor [Nakamurella alba]|nr:sigma-70 family RNA polymerase sigma factor [Nakamurella alba]
MGASAWEPPLVYGVVDRTPRSAADRRGELVEVLLAERHGLLRLAAALTGRMVAAEDLVQEVMLRCIRAWPDPPPTSPGAYLRRALVNLHHDQLRRRRIATEDPVAQPPERADGSDAQQDVLDRIVLHQQLSTLPDRLREVLVLRYYADLTTTEIARMLRRPVGTVRRQCTEALDLLGRAHLSEQDLEERA